MVKNFRIKKNTKEESLFNAAYELFIDKGIHETSISSIAKKAGVGKGTFYLYFENKYDILDRIILEKSKNVLIEALNESKVREYSSFEEEVLGFIDAIIGYLKENRLLLKLMHKNLSWALLRKAYEDYEEIHEIYSLFERGYRNTKLSKEEIKNRLFIVIELTGSVCYSSIILNEPDNIDNIKALLFESIEKLL